MNLLKVIVPVALFLIAGLGNAWGQSLIVKGKVTDASDNSSLPGCTLIVKGTNRSIITDIEGQYSIEVKKGEILVFSFIGFKTQEHVVQTETLDVSLIPSGWSDDFSVVEGTVTEGGDNLPSSGTKVWVRGVSGETFVDANGEFSIQAKMGDTLVFGFTDHRMKEIVVRSGNLNVNFFEGNWRFNYSPVPEFEAPVRTFDHSLAVHSHAFDFGLFRYVIENYGPGNVCVSPWGVANLLGMLQGGARGDTRDQIINVLDMKGWSVHAVNDYYKGLSKCLSRRGVAVRFDNANGIWADKSNVCLKTSFKKNCSDFYDAKVEVVDFQDLSSVKKINEWVKEHTKGKITSIIENLFPPQKFVLANVVYFKGRWASPFESENTQKEYFTNADSSKVEVEMMNRRYKGYYVEGDGYEGVELDYEGDAYSMFVLLPGKNEDIRSLVHRLHDRGKEWKYIRENGKQADIYLKLPKFKIKNMLSLLGPLRTLGMGLAFDESADFGDMSGPPSGYVGPYNSKVDAMFQRDIVEVDEKGTEAVAVTFAINVVSYGTHSEKQKVIPFFADRPFLFVICEKSSGSILFIGKMERF